MKEEELKNMDKKLNNSLAKNQSIESELYKLKDEIKFLLENDEKNKDIIKQQKKAVNKLNKDVGGSVPEYKLNADDEQNRFDVEFKKKQTKLVELEHELADLKKKSK